MPFGPKSTARKEAHTCHASEANNEDVMIYISSDTIYLVYSCVFSFHRVEEEQVMISLEYILGSKSVTITGTLGFVDGLLFSCFYSSVSPK